MKSLDLADLIRDNTDVDNFFNAKNNKKICENPSPVRLKKVKLSISGKSISKSVYQKSEAGPSHRVDNISFMPGRNIVKIIPGRIIVL